MQVYYEIMRLEALFIFIKLTFFTYNFELYMINRATKVREELPSPMDQLSPARYQTRSIFF